MLDEVRSDVAACLAISVQGRESPGDWYDLFHVSLRYSVLMVLLESCIVSKSPEKLVENFEARRDERTYLD
jgi:hypothetical protein